MSTNSRVVGGNFEGAPIFRDSMDARERERLIFAERKKTNNWRGKTTASQDFPVVGYQRAESPNLRIAPGKGIARELEVFGGLNHAVRFSFIALAKDVKILRPRLQQARWHVEGLAIDSRPEPRTDRVFGIVADFTHRSGGLGGVAEVVEHDGSAEDAQDILQERGRLLGYYALNRPENQELIPIRFRIIEPDIAVA